MRKRILVRAIAFMPVAAALLAAALIPTSASGQQPGQPFAALQAQLQSFQQSMEQRLASIEGGLLVINQRLDGLALAGGLVPFKAQAEGRLCDSGPSPSSNPRIVIEGSGSDLFVVTGILIKTAPQGLGAEGYTFLTANSVRIDGTLFDTRTDNLVAPVDGFGVQESADLMGMPVRLAGPTPLTASPSTTAPPGGNFPHQIVADTEGMGDIDIRLFCRAGEFDLEIETVLVSGWKSPGDAVTLTYIPGN